MCSRGLTSALTPALPAAPWVSLGQSGSVWVSLSQCHTGNRDAGPACLRGRSSFVGAFVGVFARLYALM